MNQNTLLWKHESDALSDEYATIFWEEAKKRLKGKTKMRQDLSDGEPDWQNFRNLVEEYYTNFVKGKIT